MIQPFQDFHDNPKVLMCVFWEMFNILFGIIPSEYNACVYNFAASKWRSRGKREKIKIYETEERKHNAGKENFEMLRKTRIFYIVFRSV